jgi:iduronate 2-sulfatase
MHAWISALALLNSAPSVQPAKPNILLICVDDLKPILGCYGDKTVKSPNIDALARRSVVFERAYTNQAVCSPSRNALMTGLRPQTLGIYDLPTNFRRARPDAVTIAQTFQRNGYRTEAMGKIFHVGQGNSEDAASWSVPHWHPRGADYQNAATQADIQNRRRAATTAGRDPSSERGPAYENEDAPDDAYMDGRTANEAIHRLKQAQTAPGQPFFMAVGFAKPHLPFIAPKRAWDLYKPTQFSLATPQTPPIDAPSYAPQFGGELRQYSGIPKGSTPLPDDLQRTLIHGYYAAVSHMDAQVGRVLATLKETGLEKNTIIVLWGDHGWHLGDHGMWCKHTNYEQATRIPFLVSAPGIKPGRTQAFFENVDLYPTLCEMAGITPPTGLDGMSVTASLRNPRQKSRDHAIHVYPRGARIGRAIRTERYRLVEWKVPGAAQETAEYELYDYRTDPRETKNRAAEQPKVVAELKAILARHPEAKPQISTEPTPRATTDRNALFDRRDRNKDGKLTLEEFLQGQPDPDEAPTRFRRFDANKDGVLSREEFVKSGKVSPSPM